MPRSWSCGSADSLDKQAMERQHSLWNLPNQLCVIRAFIDHLNHNKPRDLNIFVSAVLFD